MNQQDYLQTLEQIKALARIVRDMPLQEFVEATSVAETIAPFIVFPLTYYQTADNLAAIRRLAQSLLPFQAAIEELVYQITDPPAAHKP